MFVGLARFELFLNDQPNSLKAKRSVVKSLCQKLRNRLSVAVAEVDFWDLWQRTAVGVAVVSPNQETARKLLEQALDLIDREPSVEVTNRLLEVEAWT